MFFLLRVSSIFMFLFRHASLRMNLGLPSSWWWWPKRTITQNSSYQTRLIMLHQVSSIISSLFSSQLKPYSYFPHIYTDLFSGTVIDNGICHPRTNDFYICAHAGMIVSCLDKCIMLLYRELNLSELNIA